MEQNFFQKNEFITWKRIRIHPIENDQLNLNGLGRLVMILCHNLYTFRIPSKFFSHTYQWFDLQIIANDIPTAVASPIASRHYNPS